MTAPTSTPSTGLSISFSIVKPAEKKPFRLLELPDELLQLIEASQRDPAQDLRLRLKSLGPTLQDDTGSDRSSLIGSAVREQLHLCTPDKSWAIRQVSTSNTVYITASDGDSGVSENAAGSIDHDVVMANGVLAQRSRLTDDTEDGVSAIAQANTVLELMPVHYSPEHVMTMIFSIVPIFDLHSNGETLLIPTGIQPREDISSGIPAPESSVDQGLDMLCLFNLKENMCCLPSATTVLRTWQKIIEGAAVNEIKLDAPIDPAQLVSAIGEGGYEDEDMYSSGLETTQDPRTALYQSIAQTLITRTFPALGLVTVKPRSSPGASGLPAPAGNILALTLNPQPLVTFLGHLLLHAHLSTETGSIDPNSSAPLSNFLSQWRALVPVESWWPHITLSSLGQEGTSYVLQGGRIKPAGAGPDNDSLMPIVLSMEGPMALMDELGSLAASKNQRGTGAAAGTSKARKWHDKFAAQRRTGGKQ